MYKLVRNFLFFFDAERVHYFSMRCLQFICRFPFLKKLVEKKYSLAGNSLKRNCFGLQFTNPVGLAAGFDKNAKYLNELAVLGFGFVEIGTVTPLPQPGNAKPRLFRLPKDQAVINRMGFNNEGAAVVAERLKKFKSGAGSTNKLIVGGNIGKNKLTPNEDAWKDYEICFQLLHEHVDYFVVNVSSPNTPGLRDLQQKESLQKILGNLQMLNKQKQVAKPLLLKISPDLPVGDLDDIISLAKEIKLDGIVATNTTIQRKDLLSSQKDIDCADGGGLSGKPLTSEANRITRYIFEKTNGEIPVISSGGIFNGADAVERIQSGASLLQVWTGFIYEGPGISKDICQSLL